jgi:hypothetical protein
MKGYERTRMMECKIRFQSILDIYQALWNLSNILAYRQPVPEMIHPLRRQALWLSVGGR